MFDINTMIQIYFLSNIFLKVGYFFLKRFPEIPEFSICTPYPNFPGFPGSPSALSCCTPDGLSDKNSEEFFDY